MKFFIYLFRAMMYTFYTLLFIIIVNVILISLDFCYDNFKFMSPESAVQKDYLMKSLVRKSKRSPEIPVITMSELKEYLRKHPESISVGDDSEGFFGSITYFYPLEVARKNANEKNLTKVITGTYHTNLFTACGHPAGARSLTEDHIYENDPADRKYNPYKKNQNDKGGEK